MKRVWWWFKRRWQAPQRWHVLAMAIVLTLSLGIRLDHIVRSLPYARHVDEVTWADISLRMLRTGDANPHRFRKPSVPVYVMTAGFGVGLACAKLAGTAKSAKDLGEKVDRYYRLPGTALPPKALFTFASVVALGAAGYVGFMITRRAALLWLVPLLTAGSGDYFEKSWSYMNVDILGAGFLWVTLAYLFREHARGNSFASGPGWFRRLLTLGVLCGLTVGCKYNLFPILLPGALWFLLFDRRRWLLAASLLGSIAVATFFLTTPYALVVPREFIDGLAIESQHYAIGHPGRTVARGLPMLWAYIRYLAESFGWIPYLLSLAGAVLLARREPRLSVLLFAFPVAFIGYMSMQRAFFERNAISVHLFIALTLGVAILELPERLTAAVESFRPALASRWTPRVLAIAVALLVVAGIPWRSVAQAYSPRVEPRNDAMRWLVRRGKPNGVLLVDAEAKLDHRAVDRRMRVLELDPKRDARKIQATLEAEPELTIVATTSFEEHFEKGSPELKVRARFQAAERRPVIMILER